MNLNHGYVDRKSRENEFIEYVNHFNGKWINGEYGNIHFDEDGSLDYFPKKLISGIENVIQKLNQIYYLSKDLHFIKII